jgi:hypothetical protein
MRGTAPGAGIDRANYDFANHSTATANPWTPMVMSAPAGGLPQPAALVALFAVIVKTASIPVVRSLKDSAHAASAALAWPEWNFAAEKNGLKEPGATPAAG